MEWKKETLQSFWKLSKEKLIFLFCSGLLLFILALPDDGKGKTERLQEAAGEGTWETASENPRETGGGTAWEASSGTSGSQRKEGEGGGGTEEAVLWDRSYEAALEERIRAILAEVDGVGNVDVMVVLKSSEEKVLHMDQRYSVSKTEESGSGGSVRTVTEESREENAVMEGQSQSPIIEKQLTPELSGIVISADGGGSAVVKGEISEAMEALFGLPAHKIKVLKRVKEGV